MRELRNNGGAVLARVERGDVLEVTRDGTPVAELRPLPRRSPSARELVERRRHLPPLDPARLREDLDDVLDQSW